MTRNKTFPCKVTNSPMGAFMCTISVTSPKTGRVVTLKEGAFKYCPGLVAKIQAVLPEGGQGVCHLSVQELWDILNASEQARDDYKESMSFEDQEICTRHSEETDGECFHCNG